MKWNACPLRNALTTGAQWRPSGSMDQMPHMRVSRRPCVFQAREQETSVPERRRVERAPDRHRSDRGDVGAVLVHDEELERRRREPAGRDEPVPIRHEGDLAAGHRGGSEVEDPVAEGIEPGGRIHRVRLVPPARAGVGRELAEGEPADLPRHEVDLEDVGAGAGEPSLRVDRRGPDVVEVAIVNPAAVERDEGVGDGTHPARDQHLLAPVGMEQHEVRPGIDLRGVRNLGPRGVGRVAEARLAHVDNVVGEDGARARRADGYHERRRGEDTRESAFPPAEVRHPGHSEGKPDANQTARSRRMPNSEALSRDARPLTLARGARVAGAT
jgi:hypothetical protein